VEYIEIAAQGENSQNFVLPACEPPPKGLKLKA
jgi:hypothetical protein